MALSGTLGDFSLADILQLIGLQRKTGLLVLQRGEEQVKVGFENGRVVSAETSLRAPEGRIGQYLLRSGKLTEQRLEAALREQDATLQRLGHLLVEKRWIDRETIRQLLTLQVSETVYELFRWRDGEYDFQPGVTSPWDREFVDPIACETLLMQGAQMVDEWPLIERVISSAEVVLQPTARAAVILATGSEAKEGRGPSTSRTWTSASSRRTRSTRGTGARGWGSGSGPCCAGSTGGAPSARSPNSRGSGASRRSRRSPTWSRPKWWSRWRASAVHARLRRPGAHALPARRAGRRLRGRCPRAAGGARRRSDPAPVVLPGATALPLPATAASSAWLSRTAGLEDVRRATSSARMVRVERGILVYYLDTADWPKTLDEVVERGFLPRSLARDPWGRPYRYEVLPDRYRIAEAGPTGSLPPQSIERALTSLEKSAAAAP